MKRKNNKSYKKLIRNLIENNIYFTLKIRENFTQVVLCNFIRVQYISYAYEPVTVDEIL